MGSRVLFQSVDEGDQPLETKETTAKHSLPHHHGNYTLVCGALKSTKPNEAPGV